MDRDASIPIRPIIGRATRRDVLRAGSLSLVAPSVGRWADRPPASAATPGAVIVVLMVGGASPWETFDPKPAAAASRRGPFGSIATSVPGIHVAEHLPEVARRMGRLTLIRSLCHDADPTHAAGLRLLMTGHVGPGRPALGSIAAAALGARGRVPPFVILPRPVEHVGAPTRLTDTIGSLGRAFDPFVVGASAGSPGCDPARSRDRARRWLAAASARGLTGEDLVATSPGGPIWDWDAERPSVRASFGASSFGRDCWLAGRLIEAGSRVVVVPMATSVFGGSSWDAHGRAPFATFDAYAQSLLPTFDRGFAGLVDDLQARGLLDSTLVVATGEFGRTPWINESGGRDHWPGAWSALVAGGGTAGGRVVGATDDAGAIVDRPVAVLDLVATIRHVLGLAIEPGTSPVAELWG